MVSATAFAAAARAFSNRKYSGEGPFFFLPENGAAKWLFAPKRELNENFLEIDKEAVLE